MRAIKLFLMLIVIASIGHSNDMLDQYGHIIGVEYTNLRVNGTVYEVPIGNKEREQDLYWIKKALNGDKEALEVFIGSKDVKYFAIGSDKVVWLVIHKDGHFEVKQV